MKKHICITGCTKGLGRALATWFLEKKWVVSGFGRTEQAVEDLQKSFPEERSFFRVVDVADDESVATFSKGVVDALGCPDVLLNNAALINANAPLWEVRVEEFSRVVDVNIKGVANCIRHFAPVMIKRGNGIMLNLSSGWGRSTSPDVAPYCATKWAIEGLSQAMSQELPRGVSVAALNPGIINTEMLQGCFGSGASAYPTAEEWAERAGPYIVGLDPQCNGRPLTVPS
ncbi:SDR family NAD(P)-dependent oxidoreductase [Puniceicoccaceae bacterium K14]|nr:SDR family NAD(P)-dependent oxidoreductase [Puniceicoccaceae bacterium K14]